MPDVRFRIDAEAPRLIARRAGRDFELPALWLRERCQDPGQVDEHTHQRLFDPHRLPEDLALTAVEADGPHAVWLSFSDGYRGRYDLHVLADDIGAGNRLPAPRSWDGSLDRNTVRFDWPTLSGEAELFAALKTFLQRGFLILDRVPTDPERILEVARTFGFPRETNFGVYFEVYSRPKSNDLAYSSLGLGPHTDNPYREPVPGVQLLHCLINEVRGGLSTLADSVAVAKSLAKENPESYRRLADTPVRFHFRDATEEFIEWRPIIRCNALGDVTGVHYSPRLDFLPLRPESELREFHRARRRLGEMLADPRFEIRFALKPGQLLMMDNSRVVHGRTAFDPDEGRRQLQGCYIDIDEPRSRYRRLARRSGAAATTTEA